ncbi:ankyrin repeat-containing BDA1-like isoform X1 [Olea europaea subsp. europaea]|uniref:Ankyrin repeat-containing BDA1-like isoform X1 n=1 Tax=Olea europaea subsp. europaea TaxID=158383 RepID=A0A8S0RUX0_OLEEU|nr:ankyrin repeat-containing BDA1-like isoform X1 [Olea europaea subsp. europaea]
MDSKNMLDAARTGNLEVLKFFLEENPSILADLRLISPTESLLHVATKAGQLNFVHELMELDPEIAEELNKDGFRPLDIAVIMGNLSIVKELVKANSKLCRLKGKDQRTALHYAAIKGRIDIIDALLSTCPDSIQDITGHGETSLHLSVENYQFDAFSMLIKWLERLGMESVVNWEDCDGNIVMHIAVLTKQHAVIELLLNRNSIRETINVNSTNAKGLTVLDILDIVIENSYDVRIREILQAAGAVRAQDGFTIRTENSPKTKPIKQLEDPLPSTDWFKYFKFQKQRDSPSDTRNALLVVAALIATVSFQAGVTPPEGILDKNSDKQAPIGSGYPPPGPPPYFNPAGTTLLAGAAGILGSQATAQLFLFANSLGLTASVCIIIYLTGGFPFQRELHISLYSMIFTYGFAISAILEGTNAETKAVAYILLTIAFVLPFAQRWLPRWGRKAWKHWKQKSMHN